MKLTLFLFFTGLVGIAVFVSIFIISLIFFVVNKVKKRENNRLIIIGLGVGAIGFAFSYLLSLFIDISIEPTKELAEVMVLDEYHSAQNIRLIQMKRDSFFSREYSMKVEFLSNGKQCVSEMHVKSTGNFDEWEKAGWSDTECKQ